MDRGKPVASLEKLQRKAMTSEERTSEKKSGADENKARGRRARKNTPRGAPVLSLAHSARLDPQRLFNEGKQRWKRRCGGETLEGFAPAGPVPLIGTCGHVAGGR